MIKLALLLQDDHVPDRLFDRSVEVDARRLEHIDLLRASQRGVTHVDARPEVLHAIITIAHQPTFSG